MFYVTKCFFSYAFQPMWRLPSWRIWKVMFSLSGETMSRRILHNYREGDEMLSFAMLGKCNSHAGREHECVWRGKMFVLYSAPFCFLYQEAHVYRISFQLVLASGKLHRRSKGKSKVRWVYFFPWCLPFKIILSWPSSWSNVTTLHNVANSTQFSPSSIGRKLLSFLSYPF